MWAGCDNVSATRGSVNKKILDGANFFLAICYLYGVKVIRSNV